ncbi:ribosomal protein S25 [Gregarina niphandrodes]|uniref:40S ribosomal protein S25 n=1 Tax=Gregarina niphandrodes TaxID=110365 RepID=A0A023B7E0_GRENI|nr:ribosomal protein S25 [Gregarina niphandrodes]EZG67238.1 ribosomal protein S25 [Gregarina niphandrodes]|eukprot:XP_011130283.1 ribosomal protein S25 [Gregarina niphandrodes]
MPTKEKKTKAQIAQAAAAGSRARKKVKARKVEKVRNAVFFDEASYKKLETEVPRMKVITPYVVSDRLKITVSLARKGLRELESKNLIKRVSDYESSMIYTRA